MSAVRRAANITEMLLGASTEHINFPALVAATAAVEISHTLVWHDIGRYSGRQQQHIPLGGLIGALQLHGELAPFAPYLHLGQWLHIGKEAAFGLGQYQLA
jgi:hypothetical protein